jgi:hypothetical protein
MEAMLATVPLAKVVLAGHAVAPAVDPPEDHGAHAAGQADEGLAPEDAVALGIAEGGFAVVDGNAGFELKEGGEPLRRSRLPFRPMRLSDSIPLASSDLWPAKRVPAWAA